MYNVIKFIVVKIIIFYVSKAFLRLKRAREAIDQSESKLMCSDVKYYFQLAAILKTFRCVWNEGKQMSQFRNVFNRIVFVSVKVNCNP